MAKYDWKYYSLGGVTRVQINSGEDIAHLDELDQKLWTVLSCPIEGLEINPEMLKLIDSDKDGKIRVAEVVAAAKFLTDNIKDTDLILQGSDTLALNQIKDEALYNSAKQILVNLNAPDLEHISLEQASNKAIFADTKSNGDGIITVSSSSNPAEEELIKNILSTYPAKMDRSGEDGVDAAMVEDFYASCAAYSAWKAKAVFPYGDNTVAILDKINALQSKVSDFFTRCKILNFDSKTADSVAISIASIDDIASCPICIPNKDVKLIFNAINPSYQAQVSSLVGLIPEWKDKECISESDWNTVKDSLNPYISWMGAKAGANVESLGIERVNAILSENLKDNLLQLIAEDKALEAESNSIDKVKQLMLLYKDFYKFLNNYISFTDFYQRDERAIFEVGKLYIDQKCCELCFKVNDMSKHSDMASLSGMFLIYCTCTNIQRGKTMNIVAVMTDGSISQLRPGKNGVFYDCKGDDWDAVITKIVDNPISIKNAFWAPFRKFWNFCVGLINKSAEDKDKKITADLQAKATAAAADPKAAKDGKDTKLPFDIAKFAGIFAAIGLAIGAIGDFLAKLAAGVAANPLNIVWGVLAVILVVSGPSCFIAWSKLRKRNIGPILNANGWAINSKVLVNSLFGSKLTSVAKYPKAFNLNDPYIKKKSSWRFIIPAILLIAAAIFVLVSAGVLSLETLLFWK